MNLLTSYNWLKEYVDLRGMTPEEFAARVSLSGPGIEKLYPQGQDLKNIVVGQIKKIEAHPHADKLKLAHVDVGSSLRIVCGGSNLREGQWVAVALLGARVRWHGEGGLVELKPAEIRGVASEGMICAANEIGLFDAFSHHDREILDLGVALGIEQCKSGLPLADVLGLAGDIVMDIEVTTNRPDAMCLVGIAREAAAILKRPFLWKPSPKIRAGAKKLSVQVVDKKSCPRFMVVKIDGVRVGPSPWWLTRRLLSAGIRPINNMVDITNFVTLELGQPMHVYDADKLKGGLVVRRARAGESYLALNGKTYALDDAMLVVADDMGPVDLIGVMGGEFAGVTSATTSVVYEAATVDPVVIRRTARKLNLFSEAQALFEKGLSSEAPGFALARAVELCLKLADGEVSSQVADVRALGYKPLTFRITKNEVTSLIGVPLKMSEIKDTLRRLGFRLHASGSTLQAAVPWWRDHDIESGRDLVEEVARMYGYANLPAVFPVGLATRARDAELILEDRVRALAKGAGLTEVFTYSFLSRELAEKAGFDPSVMLRVSNPLTTDFEFMRTTLLPSLIQVSVDNQERFREHQIFEVSHVYASKAKDWSDLPDEHLELGASFLGGDDAWKRAKGFAEFLFKNVGIKNVTWKRLEGDEFWHPTRTAEAWSGDTFLGVVGELHPTLAERFKVEGRLALINLPLEEVFAVATAAQHYEPIPVFPEAKRDIAFLVDRSVAVQTVLRIIREASSLVREVTWFDTYEGKGVLKGKKSLAFHLTFSVLDRTLETKEVDEAMRAIEQELKEKAQAEIRAA